MAYFEKRYNGKWRAQVRRGNTSQSKTFSSLARAKSWAASIESEIQDIAEGQLPRKTLGEAFERYSKEVSPKKRGGRWEVIRLEALPATSQGLLKSSLLLTQIQPALLAQWRDARLLEVAPGSVLRELGLLSSVFQQCVREWGWMRSNPVKQIAKPTAPAHRDKVLTWREVRMVLGQLGRTPDTVSGRIGLAFLFALRTGMRAGEICGIKPKDINGHSVILPLTKNGMARSVPLSSKARNILREVLQNNFNPVFGLTTRQLDANFRKARDKAGLKGTGVVFHSTRHTAATWLAKKLSPYDLARMFGWKDLKEVMTYYNNTAEDIAKLLG